MNVVDSDRIRNRVAVRAVLLAGLVGGTLVPIYFLLLADVTPLAWDFRAYYHAAELFVRGEPFVGATPPVGGGEWVYPPIVVVLFAPLSAFPTWESAYVAFSVVNVGLLAVTAALIVRIVEYVRCDDLPTVDRTLLGLFVLGNTFTAVVLGQGQIDPLVCVCLAGGFLALERGRDVASGTLFAVAAVVKLFPVVVGLWLLHRRAYRAVAAAVGTGLAAVAASVGLFGVDTHRAYLDFMLHERSRLSDAAAGIDPNYSALTLHRPLSVLVPDLPAIAYLALATVAVAPVVAACVLHADTVTDRLVGFFATLAAALLVTPATMIHHAVYLLVPLLPLLYGIERPGVRRALCLGTLLMLFPVLPGQIHRTFAASDAPAVVTSGVMRVVTPVLSVGTVTLYGLLIALAACVSYRRRAAGDEPSPSLALRSD